MDIPPLIIRIVLKCCPLNLHRLLVCKRWYYYLDQYFVGTIREFIMRVKRMKPRYYNDINLFPKYNLLNCNEHFIFEGHAPDEEWGIFQNDEMRKKFYHQGRKFCYNWTSKNIFQLFSILPDKLKTDKLCSKVKKDYPKLIKYIPENLITYDEGREIAGDHGLEFVPKKYITREICEIAVEVCGTEICRVPTDLLSEDLYKKALEQSHKSYIYFPYEWRTLKMKELAIDSFNKKYDEMFEYPHGIVPRTRWYPSYLR